MKVRLSEEAMYHIAEAMALKFNLNAKKVDTSRISLDDTFEKRANELIQELVILKHVNSKFLEARKEHEELSK